MARYIEQMDRVHRYFRRFERVNDGGEFDRPEEYLLDDIHAFFQNCYHLKDWLRNDSEFTKHSKQQIEEYVTNTPELAICADICNSTKHLKLKDDPRSGALPVLGNKDIAIKLTDRLGENSAEEIPQTISMKVEIIHNGATLDAFDVAKKALQAWERFV
jgi:hypothetical protein